VRSLGVVRDYSTLGRRAWSVRHRIAPLGTAPAAQRGGGPCRGCAEKPPRDLRWHHPPESAFRPEERLW